MAATTGPYILRTAEELTQSMMDYWVMLGTGVSDLSVGSVIRTELEAVAAVLEQMYSDMATQLQDAIQQSAYSAFNFTPIPPVASSGYLVFSVPEDLGSDQVFPAGSLWSPVSSTLVFATTTAFTVLSGNTGFYHVPASCLTLGTLGNLAGGTLGNLLYPVRGVDVYAEDGAVRLGDTVIPSGSTPLFKGFNNGRDPETPPELRARFTAFLSSLHRSTLAALEYGAGTTVLLNTDGTIKEQVADARAIDYNVDPSLVSIPGVVEVFIYNGLGDTTSDLVDAAQLVLDGTTVNGEYVPGYKAAGMVTSVLAALEDKVQLSLTVKGEGSGVVQVPVNFLKASVREALDTFFSSLGIGDGLYISALQTALGSIPGVLSVDITSLVIKQGMTTLWSTVTNFISPSMTSNSVLLLDPTNLVINVV